MIDGVEIIFLLCTAGVACYAIALLGQDVAHQCSALTGGALPLSYSGDGTRSTIANFGAILSES